MRSAGGFAIGRLLVGGSDATSGQDTAAQTAAETTPTTPTATSGPTIAGPTSPVGTTGTRNRTPSADPTPTLAAPEGECDGTDIAVTPQLRNPVAGRPVLVLLQLRTLQSEACTWQLGKNALTVNITSGKDQIWSSRQCPQAIPVQPVVVRKAVTTNVGLHWNAKRSDPACTKFTQWAMPGWYHVTAAALGGEPSDVQFHLVAPSAATITRTASPTNSPSASQHPTTQPTTQPSGRPVTPSSHSPSGAASPD